MGFTNFANWAEPLTRWLPAPDPRSLCLCPQLNLLNPPEQNSWVCYWDLGSFLWLFIVCTVFDQQLRCQELLMGKCDFINSSCRSELLLSNIPIKQNPWEADSCATGQDIFCPFIYSEGLLLSIQAWLDVILCRWMGASWCSEGS
jgi:hypothetical protein